MPAEARQATATLKVDRPDPECRVRSVTVHAKACTRFRADSRPRTQRTQGGSENRFTQRRQARKAGRPVASRRSSRLGERRCKRESLYPACTYLVLRDKAQPLSSQAECGRHAACGFVEGFLREYQGKEEEGSNDADDLPAWSASGTPVSANAHVMQSSASRLQILYQKAEEQVSYRLVCRSLSSPRRFDIVHRRQLLAHCHDSRRRGALDNFQ